MINSTFSIVEASPRPEPLETIEMALYRQRLEAELSAHRQYLEELVIERTVKLTLANDRLQDEIMRRKRVESQLKKAMAELKQLDLMKEQFLQTISHELRTPLTSIIGYQDVLLTQCLGPLNDSQAKALYTSMDNSECLLELINDLLDLSRLECGEMPLHLEEIEINQTIEKVIQEFAARASQRNLLLTFNPTESEINLVTDVCKLQRIVRNLVGNALKFTEKGEIKVELISKRKMMQLKVSDTGVGIPHHAQKLIFDKFRQVDNSANRHFDGTGLGLPITKKLSEMLGGTISVKSKVGQGSVFTVELATATI